MNAEAVAGVHTGPAPLRRNRDFWLLWTGQTLAGFGASMTFVVLPLLLLAAGASAAVAGTLGTASLVVGLVLRLPGGVLADRFDERQVLLVCDVVQFLAVAAAAVCVFFVPLPVAVALGLVVLTAVMQEAYRPANARLLRRIVPIDQMATAVSVSQARGYAASIVAPSVGGILLALDPALPLVVDALTCFASAFCIVALLAGRRPNPSPAPTAPDRPTEPLRRQITVGWRYTMADPFLRAVSLYFAVLNLLFSAFLYTLMLGVGREPGGSVVTGLALSASAVAGLLGSLLAPLAQRRLSLPVVLAVGPALAAVLLAAVWTGAATVAFAGAFAALCLLTPILGATLATVLARVVPEQIYGRVNAANTFVSQILQPLGPLLAGLLLTSWSLAGTASVYAVVLLALAVIAFFVPTPQPPAGSTQEN